jgi:NADPH:quinone reductase-like Zn-dependent oxidoreductase
MISGVKAAVIHKFGEIPSYEDFPDLIPAQGDLMVRVKAAPLENFDKMAAKGEHYSSAHLFPMFPAIVGHGGVGTLGDGTLVAFGGVRPPYGTMAEKAVIPQEYRAYITPVPEGVDAAIAAALPASALTSYLPLKYTAKLEAGETLLINGATGVSGKLAIQVARMLGAGRIVGTGREEGNLRALADLGADAVIDLKQPDERITDAFVQAAGKGYDVILDFLWGHPTELLLRTLVPKEVGFARRRIRLVQIGQSAGASISLAAETLRTSGLELTGVGKIPPEAVGDGMKRVWEWIKEKKLHIDVELVPLKDVAEAWTRKTAGKRLVVVPG